MAATGLPEPSLNGAIEGMARQMIMNATTRNDPASANTRPQP